MTAGARADRLALCVDLGTGGPKVGFVSFAGAIVWKDYLPVETRFGSGGVAVQDARQWWQHVTAAAKRGLASGAVDPVKVDAVCCTGQWSSTVPVDDKGEPVGDCVMWMDTRGGRHVRDRLGGPVAGYAPVSALRWIRRSGGAPNTEGADPVGHILHLEHDQPEVAERARWYLEPVDYLSMCFTKVAAASPASMFGSWLTDTRRPYQLAYDPDLVAAAGIPPDKLAPLHMTGTVVADLAPSVAAELGLPGQVKVVTGVPDLHSAAVGSGCVMDFEAHLAISTTSWISCPVPFKKTDPIRQIASVPGLRPGGYLIVDNQDTSGICLQWLRDSVLFADDRVASGPRVGFSDLAELAAAAPVGSGRVIFTPWLRGQRTPVTDRHARGGFHNLSTRTSRGHLVRAVLEGVAYNNRWLNESVERFAGRRLDPIRVVGGGASSDLWCQIHADVMGRTMERVADPVHASLRGAGLLAAMALGSIDDGDVRSLVPLEATFSPDEKSAGIYETLYREFPKLHRSQRAMFKRLNARR